MKFIELGDVGNREKKLKKGLLKDVELIHVTSEYYLNEIEERGLEPNLSDFTLEAMLQYAEDEAQADGLDFDYEEKREELLEKQAPMIFATDSENLGAAVNMITSYVKGIPKESIIVIGIKSPFDEKFEEKTIASDIDKVCYEKIPPNALILITDWKKELKKRG